MGSKCLKCSKYLHNELKTDEYFEDAQMWANATRHLIIQDHYTWADCAIYSLITTYGDEVSTI